MPPKRKLDAVSEASSKKGSSSNGDMVHMLQCKEGSSDKFYEISLSGSQVICRYGKTGSAGVSTLKDFSSYTEALAYMAGILSEKLKKGYVAVTMEDTPTPAAAVPAVAPPNKQAKPSSVEPATVVVHKIDIKDESHSGTDRTYLECVEGSSSKFYELVRTSATVSIRYGRIGTDGVQSEKSFNGDVSAAVSFVNKTVREKENKGYTLVSATAYSAPSSTAANSKITKPSATVAVAVPVATVKVKSEPPVKKVVISTSSSTGEEVEEVVRYLECTEGSSRKFYEISQARDKVTIRYGRLGTDGISSEKSFSDNSSATTFVNKTVHEKEKKGYSLVFKPAGGGAGGSADTETPHVEDQSSGNLATDLENGLRVFIKGSSALPYTLKRFNGGYSCTCQGWAMQVHRQGVQATSCKHLKLVRGVEAEAERCQSSAGVKVSSAKKNNSIPASISLAQQWNASIDPTGYIMSEKLDGMRAYWCGKKLWTRSGLPIIAPEWFLASLPADLVLDGELFLGRQRFDECMSIARRTDASEEWRQLRYVVFDAPSVKGGVAVRLQRAAEALAAATGAASNSAANVPLAVTKGGPVSLSTDSTSSDKAVYWVMHPHTECIGIDHLLEELARVESLGGEGLMLRSAVAAHRGGRNSDLLKVKSFHDDEALVTAHEDGNGKYAGMVGSLVCVSRRGARFKVGSGLTDAMRSPRAAPKPGTVITFKYFELTKDGIPRFPTFLRVRPDVDKSEFPSS